MKWPVLIGTTTVLLAIVAGCGSGGSSHFTASAVQSCLGSANGSVTTDNNTFAPGSEGNLDWNTGSHDVYLAFGKDSSEAHDLAVGINTAGKAFGGGDSSSVIHTKGNVMFYVNANNFPDNEVQAVEGCLNGDGSSTVAAAAVETAPVAPLTPVRTTTAFSMPTRPRLAVARRSFKSPTGNIRCVMWKGRGVRNFGASCSVLSSGRVYVLQGFAPVIDDAAVDTGFNPSLVLPYGHHLQLGLIECGSAFKGLSCRNLESAHGFFLSRERVRIF